MPISAVPPNSDPASSASDTKASHCKPSQRLCATLRALVVDDVHINREVLCRFIELHGHVAEQVNGGAAAVERVAAGGIDVVFMDVSMPDVDGLEATRRIRRLPGAAARTPVWAVTTQVFPYQVAQCLDAGMNGHLSKPVNVHLLDEVLQVVAHGIAVT